LTKELQTEIKASCMRLLSRREHSQSELLDKLKAKGFDIADIKVVIAQLISEGWQSDQRFVNAFVRQRIQKGYGPIRIDFELKRRGLSCSCLELVFDDLPEWETLIENVYDKKFSISERRLSRAEWAKQMRFLQHRGFSGEMIRSLFDRLGLKFDEFG
jgi:regulatory protein